MGVNSNIILPPQLWEELISGLPPTYIGQTLAKHCSQPAGPHTHTGPLRAAGM